jgi:copper type II ascorbate-dependent monooxygenase-like protein
MEAYTRSNRRRAENIVMVRAPVKGCHTFGAGDTTPLGKMAVNLGLAQAFDGKVPSCDMLRRRSRDALQALALAAVLSVGLIGQAGCTSSGSTLDAGDDAGEDDDTGVFRRRDAGKKTDASADAGDMSDDTGIVDDAGDGSTGTAPTWYRDIYPIVMGAPGRCKLCHSNPPLYGAPFTFATWEDTQLKRVDDGTGLWPIDAVNGTPVYQLMAFRVLAPSNAMPPPTQPQLTAAQKRLIMQWAEAGGPAGDTPDGGPGGGDAAVSPDATTGGMDAGPLDATQPLPWADGGASPSDAGTNLAWFDTFAHATGNTAAPFTAPINTTTYWCFAFTIPATAPQTQYAVQFEPFIDNIAHIHHAFIFRVAQGATSDGDCFGLVPGGDLVASWFPGRDATVLPPNVGVRFNRGDQVVLQVHYDAVRFPNTTDNSGIRVLFSSSAGITPAALLWTGYQWSSTLQGTQAQRQNTCTLPADMTLFSDIPHMHRYGTSLLFEVQRVGTSSFVPLVDVPAWSFDDQPIYDIPAADQQLHAGDIVRTTCTWNVSSAPNGQVTWGEGSGNEMCFNFMYHYPAIAGNLRQCVTNGP